jgi:hypothetical protein
MLGMIALIILIVALVCFLLAAGNAPWPRVNLMALGLAFLTVYFMLAKVPN